MFLRTWFARCSNIGIAVLLFGYSCNVLADDIPAWFSNGRPSAEAIQAVQILQAADLDGLNPEDYQASLFARIVEEARRGASPANDGKADNAAALTRAMERFISDLHYGRVNPLDVHASFKAPRRQLVPAEYLRQAVAGHTLAASVRAAAPQLPLYRHLQQALAAYRELARNPALQRPLPPLPANRIAPGQPYAGARDLGQRLAAWGDTSPGAEAGTIYTEAMADGVKAFQLRHGLAADGVIGKSTFAALNIPAAARVRQIELTLERLRWTPLLTNQRMIVVNIPEFVLRAYDTRDRSVRVSMNVIVGKAMDKRTPLFVEDMQFIEFSPYWNIPASIAKSEVVPRLQRDPAYFQAQGLEFVSAGAVVPDLTPANLDAVMHNQMKLRQRPGPANALGDIKFVFPNSDNIYLHHTPAIDLFDRNRRDFSHGCIRVEDPMALAKFVLNGQPEWTEQRIRKAMDSGKSATLRLKQRLPVVIAYATVIVKNDDRVYFFDDIYGNDRLLDMALRKEEKSRLDERKRIVKQGFSG